MTGPLEEVHLHRLLVAIDGSESSMLALRVAITVARRDHAAVTLLTVAPNAADTGRFAYAPGVPPTTQEALDHEADKTLREAVALVPDDVPVHTVIAHGKAGPAIVAHARERDYDAVLLGARGLGRVASIIGSVSAYVLSHADVDVFVAHSAV
jgi:nucleotide-binding universal stress UspA family protein